MDYRVSYRPETSVTDRQTDGQTDRQTDRLTDRVQTYSPLRFHRWGTNDRPEWQHSKERMCHMWNIAMCDYQESVTTGQIDRKTDGRTERCRTKRSLWATMFHRGDKKNQGVFVKHYVPVGNKVQKAIFSFKVKVKVTRSLNLVSSERVSLVEYACQIWSLYLLRFKSYSEG